MNGPPETWRAFFSIGDVEEIASPGFGRRVRIAQELGLLDKLLGDDQEALLEYAFNLKSRVLAQLPSELEHGQRERAR
jgi:hypothetical protein